MYGIICSVGKSIKSGLSVPSLAVSNHNGGPGGAQGGIAEERFFQPGLTSCWDKDVAPGRSEVSSDQFFMTIYRHFFFCIV